LVDDNSRDRIFKAVRQRIKETDEIERIQVMANAIGDRRYRDLVDIVSRIESEEGWSTALEYLLKAQHQKYSSPFIIGQDKTNLEELKYREMVFELLSCKGLEPITPGTTDLLKNLDQESSLIDASRVFIDIVEKLAIEQIHTDDTLFFDFSYNISISKETVKILDQVRNKNIHTISLERKEEQFNIEPLWYTEYGRLALSTLGIKGFVVNTDTFDSILSIIQVPSLIRTKNVNKFSFKSKKRDSWTRPTNQTYKNLLDYLIHHDVNNLGLLGSRHSIPLLNILLDGASSTYENLQSSSGYREILNCMNAHLSVRDIESILVLEKSSQMKNTRIATMAILAIGSFYHESSATTLVDLLCKSKNNEIEEAATKALESVYKRCPEADYIITTSLNNECKNRRKLTNLYRRLSKEKPLYY